MSFQRGRFNDYPTGGEALLTPDALQYDRVAVDQPPGGGSAYPFAAGHALGALVADFHLAYADPKLQARRPLRLVWLHGFGLIPAAPPPDAPPPVNPREILVADADERVVFDSTTATAFHDVGWGARRVVEWATPTAVARLVFYMGQLGVWPGEIAYADAVLDPRVYARTPRRLTRLGVGTVLGGGAARLEAGWNVDLTVGAPVVRDGGRTTTTVTIDGVPGAGAGRKPGCSDAPQPVVTINKVGPDAAGGFRFVTRGCYRGGRPLVVDPPGPGRTARFAAPADRATLTLANDCGACCTDADFVNTYRGLARVHADWAVVGRQAETARDLYARNKARWETQAGLRAAAALQAVAVREAACKVFVAASYCNSLRCCIADARIRLTLQRYSGGVLDLAALEGVCVTAAYVSGPALAIEQRAAPEVAIAAGGAVVEFAFDAALPGAAAVAKLRLCIPCAAGQTAAFTVTAHGDVAGDCPYDEADVPADVAAVWAAAGLPLRPTLALRRTAAPLTPEAAAADCTSC